RFMCPICARAASLMNFSGPGAGTAHSRLLNTRLSRTLNTTMEAGLLVGYDPGGDGAHGIALLSVDDHGRATSLSTRTFETTEGVIAHLERLPAVAALGVDTLTCWSTGTGGWRPADRWLRDRYKLVRNSVMTPNGLAGSMGLNGMSVLLAI